MENKSNKSYRIKTEIGPNITGITIPVNITQQYDTFEILSLKIGAEGTYKLHNANYGIVVGRVLANNGFGVPNAKLSIFIEADQDNDNAEILSVYGYTNTRETNSLGDTYNLLPKEQVDDCHQKIGAFPSKRYLLDNDTYIEVFDKYYKYTTRTNSSGDYLICGVPVGNQTLHMDLDLSDCGILSQRPRDFVYKGYNIEQFENPNQFKTATGTSINSLSQYVQQTQQIYVNPLWGNTDLGETIGITRADVSVNFKFEPTCIFIGSVVSDSQSNGITQKCMPTNNMGVMDELTTGKGTIEMIRKTPSGEVEEFQIKGTDLIDGNGTWCYQIPMNLDYITTDEYGNVVPTDDPEIGIPTRARVRFRISFSDFNGENNTDNYFRGKMLVPNNPKINSNQKLEYDYNFGSKTTDDSYRDLLWNNVYSVKSHIPRWQKTIGWRNDRFSGIKQCNFYGQNNPIPYNSIRIKMPFMFTIMCALIKSYIRIVALINMMTRFLCMMVYYLQKLQVIGSKGEANSWGYLQSVSYTVVSDGLCPDLENWYFAPIAGSKGNESGNEGYCLDLKPDNNSRSSGKKYRMQICQQTLDSCADGSDYTDKTSIDTTNRSTEKEGVSETVCLTKNTDYLISCIEMNLAQEYKVIKFDFYNDWINGLIYIPRWQYRPPVKRTFLWGAIKYTTKVRGCFDDSSIYGRTVKYTQQCSLGYSPVNVDGIITYSKIGSDSGCRNLSKNSKRQVCHKGNGVKRADIFGKNGGIIHAETTSKGQIVYYYKPSEIVNFKSQYGGSAKKVNLYATDLILLGSLNDCSVYGIPQAFKEIPASSFVMPTNLALTNMDEQGYLYTTSGGTYCSDSSVLYTGNNSTRGVVRNGNSYEAEYKYSSTQNSDDTIYQKTSDKTVDISDYIPMTEAAGIAWNYSGPGQGDASDDGMYSPGGHFLGISCVNTQTNIKTCLNLQRICEIGATMSERREKIRKYEDGKEKYEYFVPTGFIGREEVINSSLRNMFSSLNMKPLIATKRDERTNYLIYDFLFMRSGGFDGSGGQIINNSKYRTKVTMPSVQNIEGSVVDYKANQGRDNSRDDDELNNLYRRSSEELNFGYYRFRFGLDDISDKSSTNKLISSKYLIEDNGLRYLPQYENSFYFYFGLREGATAMDRFRSDFFSTCPEKEEEVHPRIELIEDSINQCNLTWDVTLKIFGLTPTYWITYKIGTKEYERKSSDTTITFKNQELSTFNVTVRDSEGLVLTSSLNPSFSAISDVYTKMYDFTTSKEIESFITEQGYYEKTDKALNTYGGYIYVNLSNILIFGKSLENYDGLCAIISSEKDEKTLYTSYLLNNSKTDAKRTITPSSSTTASFIGEFTTANKTFEESNKKIATFVKKSGILKVPVPSSKREYTLYIGYKCNEDATYYTTVEIGKFEFFGFENFNVFYGSRYLMYDWTNDENFSGVSNYENLLNSLKNSDYYSFREETKKIEESGFTITSWLLRRAFIDTTNGVQSTNRHVFCTNLQGEVIKGITAGQPENVSEVYSKKDGWNKTSLFSDAANEQYQGYDINTRESIYPTWYMSDLSEVIENWKNKNSQIVLDETNGVMEYKDVYMNCDASGVTNPENLYTVFYGATNNSYAKHDYLVQGYRYEFSWEEITASTATAITVSLYGINESGNTKTITIGNSHQTKSGTLLLDVPYGEYKNISFKIYCGESGSTSGDVMIKKAKLQLLGPSSGKSNKYFIICPYKLNWHVGRINEYEDILMGSYYFSEKTQYTLSISYRYAYKYLGSGKFDFKLFFKYSKDGNEVIDKENAITFTEESPSNTLSITSKEGETVCGVCCEASTDIMRIVVKEFKIENTKSSGLKKEKYDVMTYDNGFVIGSGTKISFSKSNNNE